MRRHLAGLCAFLAILGIVTIFDGQTWSVSIDGGTDTNGNPIEAEQAFLTDGTWVGTAGVGQC